MTTKAQFIAAYREEVAKHDWAEDAAKFARFMAAVEETLSTDRTSWAWSATLTKTVWKAIGCKGPMTLKALRALP